MMIGEKFDKKEDAIEHAKALDKIAEENMLCPYLIRGGEEIRYFWKCSGKHCMKFIPADIFQYSEGYIVDSPKCGRK